MHKRKQKTASANGNKDQQTPKQEKRKEENVESSEEEDNLENVQIINNVLKQFSAQGGDDLGRTQEYIQNAFVSGAGVCLICISSIKRAEAVSFCCST